MAQFYTIEEAAAKVGLSVDDFKRNLATKWTNVSRFPDGRSIRFKADQIDELARTLGRGSEPGPATGRRTAHPRRRHRFRRPQGRLRRRLDVVPGGKTKNKKTGSDSDVKLEPASGKLPKPKEPTEINLDAEVTSKPPSSTRKFAAPLDIASEADVNLRPPAKGDTGSSSEFELSLAPDSSDEFELQADRRRQRRSRHRRDAGGKGLSSGDSGINLQSPADSGISLEKSSDFELDLAPESRAPESKPRSGQVRAEVGAEERPQEAGRPPTTADSEFELTLDDRRRPRAVDATAAVPRTPRQKDIFETDFELPALDDESGSEAVAAGGSTPTWKAPTSTWRSARTTPPSEDESDSEVVAIEEGGAAVVAARPADETRVDDLEAAEDDEDEELARLRPRPSRPNGALPAPLMLLLCVLIMFLSGLMALRAAAQHVGLPRRREAVGTARAIRR